MYTGHPKVDPVPRDVCIPACSPAAIYGLGMWLPITVHLMMDEARQGSVGQ